MKKSTVFALTLSIFASFNLNASEGHQSSVHWGYLGKIAPYHWGKLSPRFATCSKGNMQSPVNIIANKDTDLKPLNLQYSAGSKDIVNNGHTIQVNIKDGNVLKIDGKEYKLKQFHFHVPSENNINGDVYPLEAHFVHISDDGKIAVIGVMFETGNENSILSRVFTKASALKEGENAPCNLSVDDIKGLLPKDSGYYKFMGSLTTPPCTEGVQWLVYKKPLSVSKDQINRFFNIFGFPNNRPVQPLNGRVVEE